MKSKNEIIYILNNTNVDELLAFLRDELKDLFGEEIALQKDYDQNNPHHCFDLLEHTLRTVEHINEMELDAWDKDLLLVAGLYHDCGKPFVKMDKGDRFVYYGHAKKSRELACPILHRQGFDEVEIKRILFYIECHDAFMNYKLDDEWHNKYSVVISNESVVALAKDKMQEYNVELNDIILLVKLSQADVLAQSEKAVINKRVVDTLNQKLKRLLEIEKILNELLN